MTHSLCSLLHWLAVYPGTDFHYVHFGDHAAEIANAIKLGYVENPHEARSCDLLWVRLTSKGRELVLESLNAMEAVS